MMDYWAASGAPTLDIGDLQVNDTVPYSYVVGDTTGDGTDDLVLNVFCVNDETCTPPKGSWLDHPTNVVRSFQDRGEMPCRYPWSAEKHPIDRSEFWSVPAGIERDGTLKHRTFGLNGANGTVLWMRNMSRLEWDFFNEEGTDRLHYLQSAIEARAVEGLCPIDFVVGTIPDGNGQENLLVYRYQIFPRPDHAPSMRGHPGTYGKCAMISAIFFTLPNLGCGGAAIVWHDIYAIDSATGRTVPGWRHHEEGYVAYVSPYDAPPFMDGQAPRAFRYVARNLFLNPILQVPPQQGLRIVDDATLPALFLQRVSFDSTIVRGLVEPGGSDEALLVESYQPLESLVRLNLANGAVVWEQPLAYAPDPTGERSVMPAVLTGPPLPYQRTAESHYWNEVPCCFDLDGDHVPDVLYSTYEWSANPSWNVRGPWFIASNLRAFSGATGQPVWARDAVVEPGDRDRPSQRCWRNEVNCVERPRAFRVYHELMGDANADGADDVLVHAVYETEDYAYRLGVVDGRSGSFLWTYERPFRVQPMVMGDVDGDGGNDVAVFEWAAWEYPRGLGYHQWNLSIVEIMALSGTTGEELWSAPLRTFNAPRDLVAMWNLFRTNGRLDVNGDGAADLPVDDPLYLPDLETVHRISIRSGRDKSELYRIVAVGDFAFLTWATDLNDDGATEFGLLSGDIVDLWFTVFDGKEGTELWSRRAVAPKISEYLGAYPWMRTHRMNGPNGTHSFLLNLQMDIASFGGGAVKHPFLYKLDPDGELAWGIPELPSLYAMSLVEGPTVPNRAFKLALKLQEEARDPAAPLDTFVVRAKPWTALGGLLTAALFPMALLLTRRRGGMP